LGALRLSKTGNPAYEQYSAKKRPDFFGAPVSMGKNARFGHPYGYGEFRGFEQSLKRGICAGALLPAAAGLCAVTPLKNRVCFPRQYYYQHSFCAERRIYAGML
jgi:hypothetical protein